MTGSNERSDSRRNGSLRPPRRFEVETNGADHWRFGENGKAPSGAVVYVLGGVGPEGNSEHREFPVVNRKRGESKAAHVERVARLVAEAMAAGGTHLLVPRARADWLGDHPLLADYFGANHELAEARAESGIVFRLLPPGSVSTGDEVGSEAKAKKSKKRRKVRGRVGRLEQRIEQLQFSLQQSHNERVELVERLAHAQVIVDSVPAIALAIAQVTRVTEELEQRVSALAASRATVASEPESHGETLRGEIGAFQRQNQAFRPDDRGRVEG